MNKGIILLLGYLFFFSLSGSNYQAPGYRWATQTDMDTVNNLIAATLARVDDTRTTALCELGIPFSVAQKISQSAAWANQKNLFSAVYTDEKGIRHTKKVGGYLCQDKDGTPYIAVLDTGNWSGLYPLSIKNGAIEPKIALKPTTTENILYTITTPVSAQSIQEQLDHSSSSSTTIGLTQQSLTTEKAPENHTKTNQSRLTPSCMLLLGSSLAALSYSGYHGYQLYRLNNQPIKAPPEVLRKEKERRYWHIGSSIAAGALLALFAYSQK